MKPRIAFHLLCQVLFCQALLLACSNAEIPSPVDVDEEYVNKQILLRAPANFNTFKTADDVNLELKYNSGNEITFPNNYNIRIFLRTFDGWDEIHEIPTIRLPEDDVVFSSGAKMPAVENIFVSPDFPDYNSQYQLRVYVSGNMKTNDGDVEVAAYTDFTVYPP